MKKNGNKSVYIAAILLFLGGFGYLLYSGMSQGTVYFLNVQEALAADSASLRQARLFGTVAETGIERDSAALGVSFLLQDQSDPAKTIPVTYKGAVPDTFKAGVEVIVEGGMPPGGSQFSASTLMTKCPSKYEKENRG